MKIVYRIILIVFGLLGVFLFVVSTRVALRLLDQPFPLPGKKRIDAILTCIQPFTLLLVAVGAALALRIEFRSRKLPRT